MKHHLSMGIITCWYGPYPWYFPYFIHSLKYNPTVDFIIITDNNEAIPNKPDNVRIIQKTLEEIKARASEKFGFPAALDYSYKFCEFKPAYGYLFPEIIKDYHFWASGDIDVIFGNIREFITDEILNNYDFISLRHDYTTGCLSIYRNTELMNSFFMRSKDYQFIFSDTEYHNFDECAFAFTGLHAGKSIFEIETKIESLTHIIKSAANNNEIRAHFDFLLMEGATGRICFDNGRIFYKGELEAILYHLVTFKKACAIPNKTETIPSYYKISRTKITHPKTIKTKALAK